jgi:hypothetical protein
VDRIVASFGRPPAGDAARPPTPALDPDHTTGAPEDPR